ncbi:MAG: plastocyanin/azurin family copper-binding protein [Chloroflexota bacterium]|nr:plastocyanin/azurin family copper-binding protein [Chloroflexota bacterium]
MRRSTLVLLTTLSLAAFAGCGSTATPTPASSSAVNPSTAASAAGGSSASAPGEASAPTGAACAPATAGATATVSVTIKDFAYSPQPIQAKVGDVVTWTNNDGAPHTASLEDDSCTTDTIANGATGSLVFNVPGTYTYKCKIHPGQMKGFSVVVS